MATLVLTAVGSVVGGPIGGALGAMLGQAIDRDVLFRPKGREGPRLTELKVQTSSYGTPIAKLFGTMRVAGTVIWSTDLIETRAASRGGKGQPSVTSYSYAASFAVLLSARAIRGVGRIWADGTLLRGAAGDFKVTTGFRLHLGGEEQAADPLIASAEGAGLTPAHRGCAYAVFEQLPLADFGNRIPSLTFEVIADDGPVSVGAIATALAPELGGEVALAVNGFAAGGASVRAVIETLAEASGGWFAAEGGGLMLRDAVGVPAVVADDAVRGSGAGEGARGRTVAAADGVPRTVTLRYYDPARDYQAGLQRARRPGAGTRDRAVEVPAVIEAGVAKGLAEAMLVRADAERVRRTVSVGLAGLAIAPGAAVQVAGEAGVWRVAEMLAEGMAVRLTLVPVSRAPLAAAAASSGRVLSAPDAQVGRTLFEAFELPTLDDEAATAPRLSIVAAGEGAGWRQAALLYSVDEGASWTAAGATAAPGVLGTVEIAPDPAAAMLIDRRGAVVVTLAHEGMMLGDADPAALDRGANLALVGDELLQFGRAEPLGGARWRLSELWRGRRGTEAAIGAQAAGDRFVLIEADCVATLSLPLSGLGCEIRVMASGAGDGAGPVERRPILTGASVLPPAPVHLAWRATGDGGARVSWVRRSRVGWRWLDRVDAPLGEEGEAYRVTIVAGDGSWRETVTAAPEISIGAAERPATVTVRQRGTWGESLSATIIVASEGEQG